MTFQEKRPGCCLACGREVYAVVDYFPADHPWAGQPRTLGRQLDHGTQVEFLLPDGSEADISFCVPCASRLTPADYSALWACVLDRTDATLRVAGRREAERRMTLAPLMRAWPMAKLRARREIPEMPGQLTVDRRVS
jgi:hypothetical protein